VGKQISNENMSQASYLLSFLGSFLYQEIFGISTSLHADYSVQASEKQVNKEDNC
jgi:hypothetical protein